MLKNPIVQKSLIRFEDYNDLWENVVSKCVETVYKDAKFFVNAYAANSHKVFVKMCNKMKVVPIDLKETLYAFYKRLNTYEADGPKSVA